MVLALLAACSSSPKPAAPAAAPAEPTPEAAPAEANEPAAPKNHPPVFTSISLSPAAPTITDPITVSVQATDKDGDPIDFDYRWTIDDAPVLDVSDERLPAGRYKKGDQIKVAVTASDDKDEVEKDSAVVTVANTVPVFRTQPHDVTHLDGFKFQADDIDGDTLTWRLEGAPPGMSISSDGVISYKGSEDDPGGDYTITVVADDGDGWGRFSLPLKISPGSKAAKAAAAAKPATP